MLRDIMPLSIIITVLFSLSAVPSAMSIGGSAPDNSLDPGDYMIQPASGAPASADRGVLAGPWGDHGDHVMAARGPSSLGTIRPAVDLSGLPIFGRAAGSQSSPDVAWGDTSYLAVWCDNRYGNFDILATRIMPDGELLDPMGFAVCNDGNVQTSPAVAFDGENWLVVWLDQQGYQPRIAGARVSQDGSVIDMTPFVIEWFDSNDGPIDPPEIAFGGSNYLVVYGEGICLYWDPEMYMCMDWDDEIKGRFVSPDGIPGASVSIAYLPYAVDYGHDIAFDGLNYLVAWSEQSDPSTYRVYVQFLDTDGLPVGSELAIYSGSSSVAGVGLAHHESGRYIVTWSRSSGADFDVYAALVSDSGWVTHWEGVPVASGAGDQSYPRASVADTVFTVAWRDLSTPTPGVYAARVDTGCSVLDVGGVRLFDGGDHSECAASSDGDVSLIVGDDRRIGGAHTDVLGARFDALGACLDSAGIILAGGWNYENPVATAYDGTNYLLVWEDGRGDGPPDIYCARVDAEGTLIDSLGIQVSPGPGSQTDPEVSFDGSNYLIVWTDVPIGDYYGNILCARVTPSGTVLDPSGIVIAATSADERYPSVSFDGQNHVVAWRSGSGLRAGRVSPFGVVLDVGGVTIASSLGSGHDVAPGDTASLVVYTSGNNIYGKRFGRDGVVIDATPISIATHSSTEGTPAAAFAENGWLVTWIRYDSPTSSYDVYAGRVGADGVPLDGSGGFAVSTAAGNQVYPAVCFNDGDFLVAWSDYRSGSDYDVYCARVGTDGVVQDSLGLGAGLLPEDQVNPALTTGGLGWALLAYSSFDGGLSAYRIRGNLWDPLLAKVEDAALTDLPIVFRSHPNPFGFRTSVRFTVPADGRATLAIYDATGRRIRRLLSDDRVTRGTNFVAWDGADEAGVGVASGVYFVRLKYGGRSATSKLVLVR